MDRLAQQATIFWLGARLECLIILCSDAPPFGCRSIFGTARIVENQVHDLSKATYSGMPVDESDSPGISQMFIQNSPKGDVRQSWPLPAIHEAIKSMPLALPDLVLEVPTVLVEVGLVGEMKFQCSGRVRWIGMEQMRKRVIG